MKKIKDNKDIVARIYNQVDSVVKEIEKFNGVEKYISISNFSRKDNKFVGGHCPLNRDSDDTELATIQKAGYRANALGLRTEFGDDWRDQIREIMNNRWDHYVRAYHNEI
jgi:hypothetical protein